MLYNIRKCTYTLRQNCNINSARNYLLLVAFIDFVSLPQNLYASRLVGIQIYDNSPKNPKPTQTPPQFHQKLDFNFIEKLKGHASSA